MWNHRVFRNADGEYSIREAYYTDDTDLTKVTAWTRDPIAPLAWDSETDNPIKDLRQELTLMLKALDKPILDDNTTE